MDLGYDVIPGLPCHGTAGPDRATVVLWQEPPGQSPKCLGRFRSPHAAARWWTEATGTAYQPLWHDQHPMATVAARVKPAVWCGGLSPQAFMAWVDTPQGVQPWTSGGRVRWPDAVSLETALWQQGMPFAWWTPAAIFEPGTPDRAPDMQWGWAEPQWHLGQGAHGGIILWQWAHDTATYKVRWIEQAQDPQHTPYEWPRLTDALQWIATHDPGRPVSGYAPSTVQNALLTAVAQTAVRLMA